MVHPSAEREHILERLGYQSARFAGLLVIRGITTQLDTDELRQMLYKLNEIVALLETAKEKLEGEA